MAHYIRPTSLDAALAAMAERPWRLLAGGTDFYPAQVGRAIDEDVLDLTAIEPLRSIAEAADGWRLGALATWSDLVAAPLPAWAAGLRAAAGAIGGRQIQNTATLGGNLCNASPAADGAPNWLVLDADLELVSPRGTRRLPVRDFLLGNRCTGIAADEILTVIRVPRAAGRYSTCFLKLGARRYLVISIVMVALALEIDQGLVAGAAAAVGACSPAPMRLPVLEACLVGRPTAPDLVGLVDADCLQGLAPIDDIRATAAYRRAACLVLLRRGLAGLVGPSQVAA